MQKKVQLYVKASISSRLSRWDHIVTQVSREKQEIYVNGHLQTEVHMTSKATRTITWAIYCECNGTSLMKRNRAFILYSFRHTRDL